MLNHGPAICLLLLILGGSPRSSHALDFNHDAWDQILKKNVRGGLVDYAELKANPQALAQYLNALGSVKASEYGSWNRNEKIAFWINAYNALTVGAVIENYPIRPTFPASLRFPKNSIRQIPGVWDKLRFKVMGREVTLEEIEHQILRKEFKEPRVHMALVCASIGCPPLREEAFTGERLASQLDDQARLFFASPKKFRLNKDAGGASGLPGPGIVYLSPIFRWFGDDFKAAYASPEGFGARRGAAEKAALSFISRYLGESDRRFLQAGGYLVEYLDYDWSLNERAVP